MRVGRRRRQEGDLSEVNSPFSPPNLRRVGAGALMRDPVELLGCRLKERWDVETGQVKRMCLSVFMSGFRLCYWSSLWKLMLPGSAAMFSMWGGICESYVFVHKKPELVWFALSRNLRILCVCKSTVPNEKYDLKRTNIFWSWGLFDFLATSDYPSALNDTAGTSDFHTAQSVIRL